MTTEPVGPFPRLPIPSGPSWSLGQVLTSVGCLGVIAAILLPVFEQQHESRRRSCISNHKQVALALLMYAEDSDGQFPRVTKWMDGAYPYSKNWSVFQC